MSAERDVKRAPTLDDLRARRGEIMEAARRNGATAVWVFGSVARGDAQPGSDVDLLVELEPGRSLLDLAGLHLDLCDLLDLPVDVGTRGSLRERIRDKVLAEAVPL